MERKPDDQRAHLVRFNDPANSIGVVSELDPVQRLVGRGDTATHVGERHANGLGAKIEPEQPGVRRKQRGQVLDGNQVVGGMGEGHGCQAALPLIELRKASQDRQISQ